MKKHKSLYLRLCAANSARLTTLACNLSFSPAYKNSENAHLLYVENSIVISVSKLVNERTTECHGQLF